MTRQEFIKVMAYLTAGSGRDLAPSSLEVYFDLLGDLPLDALAIAAKRVLLTHKWATFPSVAELREAAVETQQAQVVSLSPGEAWSLAWRAVGATDPEIEGSFARATSQLPPLVTRAISVYGIQALCYGKEPVAVVRAQFTKIYEQLAERQKQNAMLPEHTRRAIESHAEGPRQAVAIAGWVPPAPEAA